MRIVWSILFAASFAIIWFFLSLQVHARDPDGKYADSPLRSWFQTLRSENGLCCDIADGMRVDDVDWDTQDGRYLVRIQGKWVIVPEQALVKAPNRLGPAIVWPLATSGGLLVPDASGNPQIRCFLPGAGT